MGNIASQDGDHRLNEPSAQVVEEHGDDELSELEVESDGEDEREDFGNMKPAADGAVPDDLDDGKVDVFAMVKTFRDSCKAENMWDWKDDAGEDDEQAKKHCKLAYNICSRYHLAHVKVIICTTAASCSKLVRTTFASGKDGQQVSHRCSHHEEEAAKDVEANFWGDIVHCNWYERSSVWLPLTMSCSSSRLSLDQREPVLSAMLLRSYMSLTSVALLQKTIRITLYENFRIEQH